MADDRMMEGVLETSLYADDLDAAEAFYSDILGLEKITRAGNRHVFYRCGPGVLLIFNPRETVKPSESSILPVPPHGATGQGHICFKVSGNDIEAVANKLLAAGIAIEADFVWPSGGRSIYFRDPAGNSLECTEPKIWGIE